MMTIKKDDVTIFCDETTGESVVVKKGYIQNKKAPAIHLVNPSQEEIIVSVKKAFSTVLHTIYVYDRQ